MSSSPDAPVNPPGKARPGAPARLDLSRLRHDLRTPINHILGYCELLQEDEGVPAAFQSDLAKIHGGGQELLGLIREYFDEATFEEKRKDLQRLCHELRTPVNHIVGYSELLEEQAEELHLDGLVPDLRKIADAGHAWLDLMEEHLVRPAAAALAASAAGTSNAPAPAPPPTLLQADLELALAPAPEPRVTTPSHRAEGHLLIADDDASNRDVLSRRLQRQGYRTSLAASGLEVLEMLRTGRYDLLLLDMIMPGLDGYQVLLRMKSDPALAEMPVIILSSLDQENHVARCIEAGAEDYVPKPFNSVFLRARIGACLERKRLRDQERQTYEALRRSQKILCDELAEASAYVRSLLPPPLTEGRIRADWRFQPSTQLGGDALGYHRLDDGRFAGFILDVCGHGVGAALLSVSVMNVLKARSMPGVDFGDPGAVLAGLNDTFPMERQNNMFFTLWYGVFQPETRELAFACGGHPPAVLLHPGAAEPQPLKAPGPIVGGFPGAPYATRRITLPPDSRVFAFSDGVYELARGNGKTVQLEEFIAELGRPCPGSKLDSVLAWAAEIRGGAGFEDDLSIVEFSFP